MIFLLLYRRWNASCHKPSVRIATALLLAVLLNVLFGLAFYFVEGSQQSGLGILDSVWWAMVTMTTVGYGDYFPKTTAGRFLVAYPCLIIGIGLVGYSLGVIAESMLDAIQQKKKGTRPMNFEDHLVICQCPSIARILKLVAQFRAAHGDEHRPAVVVSSRLEELPAEFQQQGIHFVKGVPTSEEVLLRAGVGKASGVIVLAHDANDEGSDAESFTAGTLVKLIAEDVQRPISLVIELAQRKNMRMMERVGADGVIPAEGITDMLLMQEIFNPGLRSLFEDLVTYKKGSEFYIVTHRLMGYTLREVQMAALQDASNLQIIGVIRDQCTIVNPPVEFTLAANDQLILLADVKTHFQTFQQTLIHQHSQQPLKHEHSL
jgi:voltage-gated potassium channel